MSVQSLCAEASLFAESESSHDDPALYGVTDGKAVGTYIEHKFRVHLSRSFSFEVGNSAEGIDFPSLAVDIKVTSRKQPQSSCPFRSARQKIYGLGYSLLVFVYDKTDADDTRTGRLSFNDVIFVEDNRTADFQTTTGLIRILDNSGNTDDILAFFEERRLPIDEIAAQILAEEVVANRPSVGYLTISPALQWRLQYSRAIKKAGEVEGIRKLLRND